MKVGGTSGRFPSYAKRKKGGGPLKNFKPLGIALLLLGGILVVIFLPCWLWLVLIGLGLILAGLKILCVKQ